jgi:hypothetical protein
VPIKAGRKFIDSEEAVDSSFKNIVLESDITCSIDDETIKG